MTPECHNMLFNVLKVKYYEGDSDDDGRHREKVGKKEHWRRVEKEEKTVTRTKRKCKKHGQRGGRGIRRGEAKRKINISCNFS